MDERFQLRKTYGRGWDTWDAKLLLSAVAPGFVFDDPAYPEPVTAENMAEYMAGWKDRVRSLGGSGEIISRDRVHLDRDGANVSWHWWRFAGTNIEGSAVTRTTDQGVQYERMTYYGELPNLRGRGRDDGLVITEDAAPWQDWHEGSIATDVPRLRYRIFFDSDMNETKGLVQGVLEYPPGARSLAHWHTPIETYFVLAGSGTAHIGDKTTPMTAGDSVFVPSKAVHWFQNTGADILRVFWTLNCDSVNEIDFTFVE